MATAGCFTRFGAEYGSHLLKKPEKIDQKGMNYEASGIMVEA